MKPNKMTQKWSPSLFKDFHKQEHDACGIVACLEKSKRPTRKNIFDCIDALVTMNHRAGFINGEGDGVGIHIDIPTSFGKKNYSSEVLIRYYADKEEFAVGHVFISQKADWDSTKQELLKKLENYELEVIFETDKVTDSICTWSNRHSRKSRFLAICLLSAQNWARINEDPV